MREEKNKAVCHCKTIRENGEPTWMVHENGGRVVKGDEGRLLVFQNIADCDSHVENLEVLGNVVPLKG